MDEISPPGTLIEIVPTMTPWMGKIENVLEASRDVYSGSQRQPLFLKEVVLVSLLEGVPSKKSFPEDDEVTQKSDYFH